MKLWNKKPGKSAGFTLVEMLIVVAIIAILVAVSIPLVSSSLDDAKKRTDQANERSAKAEAVMAFLGAAEVEGYESGNAGSFCYDAGSGTLVLDAGTVSYALLAGDGEGGGEPAGPGGIAPYGKCTVEHEDGIFAGGGHGPHEGGIIKVSVSADGSVSIDWTVGGAGKEPEPEPPAFSCPCGYTDCNETTCSGADGMCTNPDCACTAHDPDNDCNCGDGPCNCNGGEGCNGSGCTNPDCEGCPGVERFRERIQ